MIIVTEAARNKLEEWRQREVEEREERSDNEHFFVRIRLCNEDGNESYPRTPWATPTENDVHVICSEHVTIVIDPILASHLHGATFDVGTEATFCVWNYGAFALDRDTVPGEENPY